MTAPTISLTQNIVRVGMAELLSGGKVRFIIIIIIVLIIVLIIIIKY